MASKQFSGSADTLGITSANGPFSIIRRGPTCQRLWLGAICVLLFICSIAGIYSLRPHPPSKQKTVGQDFIAFYAAGTFLHEGRSRSLYDLRAIGEFQQQLARRFGDDLGGALGPWWNPPFYAWLFYPLADLPYPAALKVWLLVNAGCLAAAIAVLTRWVQKVSPGSGWTRARYWLLTPVLILFSTPCLQTFTHAQNSCMSLLILTAVVAAWREERAFLAGLAIGLLAYKPQLAAGVAAILCLSLGWRALGGLAISVGLLLLVNVLTLPGTLGDFRHQLPLNLQFVLVKTPYLWDRHVTLLAFWRLLLQGTVAGQPSVLVKILTDICVAVLAIGLGVAAIMSRRRPQSHLSGVQRFDRLIAATILATPLLMPFYFDYDQLLLAIPITLLAVEELAAQRDRFARAFPHPASILCVYYPWLMVNPDVAGKTRLNVGVVLLAAVAVTVILRALKPIRAAMSVSEESVGQAKTLAA